MFSANFVSHARHISLDVNIRPNLHITQKHKRCRPRATDRSFDARVPRARNMTRPSKQLSKTRWQISVPLLPSKITRRYFDFMCTSEIGVYLWDGCANVQNKARISGVVIYVRARKRRHSAFLEMRNRSLICADRLFTVP